MPPPAILTEQLTRTIGAKTIVDRVNLSVSTGVIFGVLGPMGAGKTTLIRLLLGLVEPTYGAAWVLGYNVRANADAVRAHTGVVLQSPGLYENLTAWENLDLFGRIWHLPTPERNERIRALLRHHGLWERRNERVADWSHGMKHKLAILRALMHRPKLLVLDEPTAGLDAVDRELLRTDLAVLARQEGVTALIATHDPAEAALCDEIVIMHKGRIVAAGSPDAIVCASAAKRRVMVTGHGFTAELVDLVQSRQDVTHAAIDEQGRLIIEVSAQAVCAAVVNLLVESGAAVDSVTRCNDDLATVYRTLVEETHEDRPVSR
ncbi:MAG: ABC transporter ATP-binding protein [Caldilinea sp.]|nr:ABC transporter ATP-binding protein [Caldilinea sp.]MDW8441390.1 ABC transporter ATP-binding protein [Caldilineaceae bacterium]